jgi:hypothetical protein
MAEKVVVHETVNQVVVGSAGLQGPRGRTILNGHGVPAPGLGLAGDFYYDKDTTRFYGPKEVDTTWTGVTSYLLYTETALRYPWELSQVTGPVNGIYSLRIEHNLHFQPNVTVKSSTGDVLETGIDYNSIDVLTLTMSQAFSGTAYLS